jgi:hypothetical protein
MNKEKVFRIIVGIILPFTLYYLAAKVSNTDFFSFISIVTLILIGSEIQRAFME